jgi:hypothetical protein
VFEEKGKDDLTKMTFKNSQDNNLIRDNIIRYFPERDCITLSRPVEEERDLQKLNEIPFNELKTSFKMEFNQLKSKVYQETLPKKINNRRLTGPILANLIVEFVNTINSGDIPEIDNSWDSVIKKDILDYYEKALWKYKTNVTKLASNLEQEEITRSIYTYKYEAYIGYTKVYNFNQESFQNKKYLTIYEEYKAKLYKEMTIIEEKSIQANSDKCSVMCKDLLNTLYNKNVNFDNS